MLKLPGQDPFTSGAASGGTAINLLTGQRITWTGGGGTAFLTDTELKLRTTAGGQLTIGIAGQAVWIMNGSTNNFWCDPGSVATIQGAAIRADTSASADYIRFGSGRNIAGTNGPDTYSQTSGYKRNIWHTPQFTPPSGSGSWAGVELNPTINGVSSGTATMLAVAPVVTALTGGTVNLLDLGTTTTDYSTGFSSKFKVDSTGAVTTGVNVNANAFVSSNTNSVALSAANTNVSVSVTGPVTFGAGSANASSNVSASGTFSKTIAVVGTGADTTEDNLMTSALAAAAMNVDGRGIRVTAWGDGVSTADVTTLRAYFGATVVVSKILTASQANTWRCTFEVLRTGATTQIATGTIFNGGTANSTAQTNASPAETLANAITVKFTGQRATSSVANSIRQLGMIVEFFN